MTTTDPGATPGTDLATFGRYIDGTPAYWPLYGELPTGGGKSAATTRELARAIAEGGQLIATDVKPIPLDLTLLPLAAEEPKPRHRLDLATLHTAGTVLLALPATVLAMSLLGGPMAARALSALIAFALVGLSILGLAGCARRASTRMQGR